MGEVTSQSVKKQRQSIFDTFRIAVFGASFILPDCLCVTVSVVEKGQLTRFWEDVSASIGANLPSTAEMGAAILFVP